VIVLAKKRCGTTVFRNALSMDNRPLTFEDFEHRVNQSPVCPLRPPGPVRNSRNRGGRLPHRASEFRPHRGLVDPQVEIRPRVKVKWNDPCWEEIRVRAERHEPRPLVLQRYDQAHG